MVLSIAVGGVALINAEFLPTSLLTSIATDLHVSDGTAGQAVTVTAAVASSPALPSRPCRRTFFHACRRRREDQDQLP